MKILTLRNISILTIVLAIIFWGPKIYNSCFETKILQDKIKVDDVWYHEPGNYSVGSYDANGKYTTVSANTCGNRVDTVVIRDLPPGTKMYYEYKLTHSSFSGCKNAEGDFKTIHITKDYNLEGGGWNHGKFGHGQTYRIK